MNCHPWIRTGVLAVLLAGLPSLFAEDWPHWRGPSRNGHTTESSGWNGRSWIAEKPLWDTSVGEGASSPLVVGDAVFTLGWANERDTLRCLDAATGNERWAVDYPCPQWGRFHEGDEGVYSGASSTPEFDPETGLLYTLSVDGDLRCWDTRAAGKSVWRTNLYETYKVPKRPKLTRAPLRDYGYTSCPLVHRDWVLVEVGATTGCLMAFDKATGRKIWASECTDAAGHNGGPVPITVANIPCVALLTIKGLVVVRLDAGNEGKTLAQYPWITDFANNIASPAVQGDNVLITAQYNHRTICRVQIKPGSAEKVWEVEHSSKVCSPVIHEGHVYFAWQRLRCLDWETGQQKWEGGTFSDPGSCVVTSDDRLIVYGYNGKLALVETASRSPDRYQELALRDRIFPTEAWPHVTVANGRVLCRDRAGSLVCFAINR